MKRITELGFLRIRNDRLDGVTWETLEEYYGIPKEELKKQYKNWHFKGTTESATWFWTKRVLLVFFIILISLGLALILSPKS